MIRSVRALPALLLVALLTAGCGTEEPGSPSAAPAGTGAPTGTATPTGTGAPAPADPAELASRAQALGIAPEHVYTTEAPGYTLARQSVGVYGGDGFSATYVSPGTGAQLHLYVDRGTLTAENCPIWPATDDSAASTPCTRDGDAWVRGTGKATGYLVPRQGHVVRVTGENVPRAVLRTAATRLHRPTAEELDALLPPAPASGGEPVERGDLPPVGDAAPDNHVNTGG
ncbi:hypothetical protein [Streptomyces sp. bgisy154]|uniref:hypothetical protein n=1 Tax=Streptomyces sp. bgisy154 TaxID=3413794 RepID=UPI003D753A26